MMLKKILLISDYGTPTGGAELMMLSLRDGLKKRGYDVKFFTSSVKNGGIEPLADDQCLGTDSSFRTLLQSANPWAFQKLKQILQDFQPDVVHVRLFLTQLSPLILPLLKKIPSLYHVAWYRPICPLGTKLLPNGKSCSYSVGLPCYQQGCLPLHDWLPLMFQMKLWQHWRDAFNLVVANSYAVKEALMANGIKPVTVVWNGIPVCSPRPPLNNPPIVAFAGRLVWEKGVDILIKAFAQVIKNIPSAQLWIVGQGEAQSELELLIKKLNLQNHVTLYGYLPRPILEEKFPQAWVQVVPSRWAEPFGIVAIEAMMRGTAVIATDSGGLREIVKNQKSGFLISPEDIENLAQRLEQLLSNRALAEQMGQKGREIALNQFTEDHFVDQFIDLYQQIILNSIPH